MNQTMFGKPPTRGKYYCTDCFNVFKFRAGHLRCPKCLGTVREDFVLVDVRDVPEELLMHTQADYHGG